MKTKFAILFLLLSIEVISQNEFTSIKNPVKLDTIRTYNKIIACNIKEIADKNVKFTYPNEDILISLSKNRIEKISFSSGRVQRFSESSNYQSVIGWEDWEKVGVSIVPSEVGDLYKLGDVSAKAKAGTVMSNMNKIKDKALRKLKIRAAMMGANTIYLTSDHTEGNRSGVMMTNLLASTEDLIAETLFSVAIFTNTKEVMLTAVAYTNSIPDPKKFRGIISKKPIFNLTEIVSMPFNKKTPRSKKITHENVDLSIYKIEGDFVKISHKGEVYSLIYLSEEKIILMKKDKRRTYNYILE